MAALARASLSRAEASSAGASAALLEAWSTAELAIASCSLGGGGDAHAASARAVAIARIVLPCMEGKFMWTPGGLTNPAATKKPWMRRGQGFLAVQNQYSPRRARDQSAGRANPCGI